MRTVAETFDDHWLEAEGPLDTPCHIWQRSIGSHGYGTLRANGWVVYAHRYAYEREHGPLNGACCLHKCDTPSCVNPEHLFPGTIADNVKDMYNKGRNVVIKGEEHYRAVLTAEDVKAIKKRYRPRSKTDGCIALAREFGVDKSCVSRIANGRRWTHVE